MYLHTRTRCAGATLRRPNGDAGNDTDDDDDNAHTAHASDEHSDDNAGNGSCAWAAASVAAAASTAAAIDRCTSKARTTATTYTGRIGAPSAVSPLVVDSYRASGTRRHRGALNCQSGGCQGAKHDNAQKTGRHSVMAGAKDKSEGFNF